MKVVLEKFEVSDGALQGVSGFRIGTETTIQTDHPLRSMFAKHRNRKNSSTSISFNVTRLHATVAAAETFLLRHGVLMPKAGLMQFTAQDGRTIQKSYMRVSMAQVVEVSYIGCTTIHSYKFVGGEIFATES